MTYYIVSGCPRSGTSLTMRILHKAGLPIAADNKRKADYDNKHGYFEIDNIINKLKDNPDIILHNTQLELIASIVHLFRLERGVIQDFSNRFGKSLDGQGLH